VGVPARNREVVPCVVIALRQHARKAQTANPGDLFGVIGPLRGDGWSGPIRDFDDSDAQVESAWNVSFHPTACITTPSMSIRCSRGASRSDRE
jgi:hypothetical protein